MFVVLGLVLLIVCVLIVLVGWLFVVLIVGMFLFDFFVVDRFILGLQLVY